MSMENYTNNVPENYKGDVLLTILGSIELPNVENLSSLNGYTGKYNVAKIDNFPHWNKLKQGRRTPVQLRYNAPNETLYATVGYTLKGDITEEEIKDIYNYTLDYFKESKDFIEQPLQAGNNTIEVPIYSNDQVYFVTKTFLDPPKGFIFLEDIFEDSNDSLAYPEFLNNTLMYERLVFLCGKKKQEIPEKAITGVMLPVHQKDPKTGTTCVMKEVKQLFEEYKLAQNYIRGFDEGTPEYQTGQLMMLAPKFSTYMLGVAKRALLGRSPDMEVYQKEINKAIKYVQTKRQDYLDGRDVQEEQPEIPEESRK